ncbi:MAG: HAD hydrolase-like protein [Lachnospiraceae bacterium]|nr:HAD hydrolase-like protein [Lachnospiraceae bacterium]
MLAKTVRDVDYGAVYASGIRGIIFDIDNTLVAHGMPADGEVKSFLDGLSALGFGICLISNNKESRAEPFASFCGTKCLCRAGKPRRSAFYRAMDLLGTGPSETLFVGDQLLTDVLGANRAGLTTCMVIPVDRRSERGDIPMFLKRFLEYGVLRRRKRFDERA